MLKQTLEIDGNNFSTFESFYKEVDIKFTKNLDWETGKNLDAFNDILRGGFGVYEYDEPVKVIWLNSQKSRNDLGWDETIKYLNLKLQYCHPSNIKFVKADLKRAKQHNGETLFDILVSIIKSHDHVELVLS